RDLSTLAAPPTRTHRQPKRRPVLPKPARVYSSCRGTPELRRFRHHLELQQTAVLLLLEVLAALLDVDVVPRQHLVHRPGALRVERGVDAEVGEGLPPDFGLEAFGPAVEAAAAPPGFLERHRNAAVATRQDAFKQAEFDVVLLDLDALEPAARLEVAPR